MTTSSNFFEFCFRMFFSGDGAVPANGISAIPNQLAGHLEPDQIRLNSPVQQLSGNTIRLQNGEVLRAGTIVLAVDAAQSATLLGNPVVPEPSFNKTTCTYFAADPTQLTMSPEQKKLLLLNTTEVQSCIM
ncbi:FAD-dependent oxidoreductase [Spirosoma telluris]|uniref:FAD-dependent oxidoreductase n=1 Tax=Spirosoma telluris TaxID=2183553 RepID=UPI002FC310EB